MVLLKCKLTYYLLGGEINMITKKVLNGETNLLTILKFFNQNSKLNVFADEGEEKEEDKKPEGDSSNSKQSQKSNTINYEDLISKARKEEKDKLYPKIKSLETEVEKWTKTCNEHLIKIAEKEKEIETLNSKIKNSGNLDSEAEKTYKKEIEDLKKQVKDLEENKVDAQAIEDRVREEYEIKLYKEQKLREAGEEIIPELILGESKEDIDNSIEISKKRYKEMEDRILKGKSSNNSVSSIPSSNVNTKKFDTKNLKVEDIKNMDPRSAEYKEFRMKMGLK